MPRSPSAGLSSTACGRKAIGLSPAGSQLRTVIGPPIAWPTRTEEVGLLLDCGRRWGCAEKHLGAYHTAAFRTLSGSHYRVGQRAHVRLDQNPATTGGEGWFVGAGTGLLGVGHPGMVAWTNSARNWG